MLVSGFTMMINSFQTPETLFEFRRIVFLILQECLDHRVVEAVTHQNRNNDEYISIQFNDKVREGEASRGFRCLPDVDLLFLTRNEHKVYRELHEQWVQAQIAKMHDEEDDDEEDDDDDDQGDDADQGDDTPPATSPEIEFSAN